MATQKCPKCTSKRVRLGYQPTRWFMKIALIYNLLCDDCNWEFRGLAIPGTVHRKTRKRRKTGEIPPQAQKFEDPGKLNDPGNPISGGEMADCSCKEVADGSDEKKKVKKRVRVRLR